MNHILALLRKGLTALRVAGKSGYLKFGSHLHVGKGVRLWAPSRILIGNHVYIGKDVNIEANCEIGDFCLLANRVAIIGRNDHDYTAVGFPMRYAPWVGSRRLPSRFLAEKVVIEADVWIGYGAILLTGTVVGRGSVVAAGSVVVNDIPPYSIVAGVPARVLGKRFDDNEKIAAHEFSLNNGNFGLSELGYDSCIIEPASLKELGK